MYMCQCLCTCICVCVCIYIIYVLEEQDAATTRVSGFKKAL